MRKNVNDKHVNNVWARPAVAEIVMSQRQARKSMTSSLWAWPGDLVTQLLSTLNDDDFDEAGAELLDVSLRCFAAETSAEDDDLGRDNDDLGLDLDLGRVT